ncbi:unnamed protein product [Clavelina lepadiformis]|uniref:Uncharacterized protein n=1 Tax=Clavelina lepadiformis TaxID=159417 RepID=A0ABP0G3Y8_CLALP
MEFGKVHENMEDMHLKLLAETKRTESMNNEIHSEKASVVAHLKAIEEKSLSLQDIEILPTETGATFTLMSNNVIRQSENEGSATFNGEVVDFENLNKRNSHEEYSKSATNFSDENVTNRESNTTETRAADTSADGHFAFASRNHIYLLDIRNETPQHYGILSGHEEKVTTCSFCSKKSNDGSLYLASGAEDGCLKIWNIHTRALVNEHKSHSSNKITAVHWSPVESA